MDQQLLKLRTFLGCLDVYRVTEQIRSPTIGAERRRLRRDHGRANRLKGGAEARLGVAEPYSLLDGGGKNL